MQKGDLEMGKLMQELNMWYHLLDFSPHSIVVKSYRSNGNGGFAGGEFLRVSKVKADHYNLTITQMRGKTDFDLLPSKEAQKILEDDLWVMKNKKVIKNRLEKITHMNGESVWVSVTKMPLLEGKFPCGVISISIDVNDQIIAQQKAARLTRFLVKRLFNPIVGVMPLIENLGPENKKLKEALKEILTRIKKLLQAIS